MTTTTAFIFVLSICLLAYLTTQFKKWFYKNLNKTSKNIKAKAKGIKGEIILNNACKKYGHTLMDVLLKNKDGTTHQIDQIVVNQCGIFVFEKKNYKGSIFGKESDKQWIQKIGKQKTSFYNPIHQNFGHTQAIKELLGNKYSKTPIYPVVVFGNEANIDNIKTYSDVVSDSTLDTVFQKYNENKLSPKDAWYIYQIIADANISSFAENRNHIKQIKEKHSI